MKFALRKLLVIACVLCVFSPMAFASPTDGPAEIPLWIIAPFILLLLSIAIMPFINRHWWEHKYPYVSIGLAFFTIGYYLFVLEDPWRLLHTGREYVSFIALIGSLYVVAGGIHIQIKGKSKPIANVFLLAIGGVLANVIGTTGASMILIRPYIRVNKYRIKPFHIVFFIFVVSNMGGALTPIGDPPLFLGYLKGIPFFWLIETVWFKWALLMTAVLFIFFVVDSLSWRRLSKSVRESAEHAAEKGITEGAQNVFFLMVILISVFITNPPFLRELLMVSAAGGSYFTTRKEIHEKNDFNFLPIKEVVILFFGIFATMIPALDWLSRNASSLGIQTHGQFFWATGVLSAFLDNAPTYLNFLSAATGAFVPDDAIRQIQHLIATNGIRPDMVPGVSIELKNTMTVLLRYHYDLVAAGTVSKEFISTAYLLANHGKVIQAISLGAVFFGACTYIGNGPNFMVKTIAEQSGVKCPSFVGYLFRYTIPILLPLLLLFWFFVL